MIGFLYLLNIVLILIKIQDQPSRQRHDKVLKKVVLVEQNDIYVLLDVELWG